MDEGGVVDGREDEVALGAFVEDAEAAAEDGLLLAGDVVGEADAGGVGAPRCFGTALGDAAEKGLHTGVAGDGSGDAGESGLGEAGAAEDEAVEGVAGVGDDGSVGGEDVGSGRGVEELRQEGRRVL